MAKQNDLFDQFLNNIEPDKQAVDYAQKAHQPVRDFLKDDEEFGEYFVNSFLYGSYKRHTAVGEIKDIDIVILTNFDSKSGEYTPQKVLSKLKAALARYYKDPENPEYQRRSIRINQPLPNKNVEMTLDIIPAVITTGENDPLLVPDREQKIWISSHPKGHISYVTSLNKDEYSQGKFVPLVKIMKWWWKYQCSIVQPKVDRPKPKGFWVECLTGENFDPTKQEWADHFIAVLSSISIKYSNPTDVPQLRDPGLPSQTIKTSMSQEEFQIFMKAVNDSLKVAIQARDEQNEITGSKLWQQLFGKEFPLSEEATEKGLPFIAAEQSLASVTHAQQPPWPQSLGRYRVGIKGYLYALGTTKVLGGIGNNGRTISSDLGLKFVATTNARGPYEAYWQVVNTGSHAESNNCLRGNFFLAKLPSGAPSSDPLVNWERTEYTGKHWIECFIVKDGLLVARSGRFYVNVKNPNH